MADAASYHESTPLFLDHQATTPTDVAVVEAMLPFFYGSHGNPSSSTTASGREAAIAVRKAREQVAALINAEPEEIVFTSGATESNNLALLGVASFVGRRTERTALLGTAIEHKAVLEPLKYLSGRGYATRLLPVTPTARIDTSFFASAIDDSAILVSMQLASNEVGTIQPIAEVAQHAHEHGALIHSDAAQAIGKIPVDVQGLGVDLMSISAHKFYGPKGVGALYVRNGPRSFPIDPIVHGGGQEAGIRSGTLNVPGIVGFGKACELASERLERDQRAMQIARDTFEERLLSGRQKVTINGDVYWRLPNSSSITFHGLDAEAIAVNAPQLQVSAGPACNSGALEPSHVLRAMGMSRPDAYSTLRIGFGRSNTVDEASWAAENLLNAAALVARGSSRG